MDYLRLEDFHFLIFTIPGFLVVWSFRFFTQSKREGDFEYLGLSFVWGFILLILFGNLFRGQVENVSNLYALASLLSIGAIVLGWIGSQIARRSITKKIVELLRKDWLK